MYYSRSRKKPEFGLVWNISQLTPHPQIQVKSLCYSAIKQ